MIARSEVPFAELRQLLADLGFIVSKHGKFWFFEHPPSETWFSYRPYRTRERVTLIDLHMTRKHLDWREVLSEKAFDDRLKKTSCLSGKRPAMIAKSAVTFAELRQLLLDLGFTVSKRGKFWFFEHPSSGTVFGYRPYRARERVAVGDLHMTRLQLDWRGLITPEAFDERLKKATA
jgi:hypothetical protein